MPEPILYSVVFQGRVRDGMDAALVKQNLAKMLRQPPEKIELLFSGKPVALAKGVDEATAKRYQAQFAKAGALCQVRQLGAVPAQAPVPIKAKAPPPAAPATQTAKPAAPAPDKGKLKLVTCPSCGHIQAHTEVCVYCHVNIAEFRAQQQAEQQRARESGVHYEVVLDEETGMSAHEKIQLLRKILVGVGVLGGLIIAGTLFLSSFTSPKPKSAGKPPVAAATPPAAPAQAGPPAEPPLPPVAYQHVLHTLQAEDKIVQLAFAPDGHTLAALGEQGVGLWSTANYTLGQTLPINGGHRLAYHPDGRMLAVAVGPAVQLWDAQTHEIRMTLAAEGAASLIQALDFNPGGNTLATGEQGGEKDLALWNPLSGQLLNRLRGPPGGIGVLAFSPDQRRLAVAGENFAQIWEIAPDTLQSSLGIEGRVHALAFSADGSLLATAGADKLVHLWQAENGYQLRALEGHTAAVLSVAFHPDGELLASGSADNTVKLWQVKTGKLLATLEEHDGPVSALDFSPDGKYLLSGGPDQTIRVWE